MTSRFEPGGGRGQVPPGFRQNSPQPPALGQGFTPLPAAVVPGSRNVFKGRLVIIFGTGPNFGLFIYAGQPSLGNPPVLWAVAPGVTADPSGNAVQAVFGIGTPGGPGVQIDQSGNITAGTPGSGSSSITINPFANQAVQVGPVISGIFQAAMQLLTADTSEAEGGLLGAMVLGTGATAKMATWLSSPVGTASAAAGMILETQNDGATDQPVITFGTVTEPDGSTLTFSPLLTLTPFALLMYSGSSGITTVTKTAPGAYMIPIPPTATTGKGECWAHGGNGGSGDTGPSRLAGGGGGGGGGEYASEGALLLPAGGNVTGTVGGHGATTTMIGSAATITANPGGDGTTASGGVPGTGGAGGNPGLAGLGGSAPGGGQGGAGKNLAEAGAGAVGQARLTYITGAPAILASIALAAGTDQFGTAYQAGTILPGPGDGNQYNAGPLEVVLGASFTINNTVPQTILSHAVGQATYVIEAWLVTQNVTAADAAGFAFTGPAAAAAPQLLEFESKTTGTAVVGYGASAAYTTQFNGQGVAGNQGIYIRATVKFTAAGTLALTGKQLVGGNNVTVSAGGRLKLQPVVAA